jgi:hypothetical protein
LNSISGETAWHGQVQSGEVLDEVVQPPGRRPRSSSSTSSSSFAIGLFSFIDLLLPKT